MDILQDIVEVITGGLVTYGQKIAQAMNGFLKELFLEYTPATESAPATYSGLSTFGTVLMVFAGLALAIGITRWVVSFIRSRG